MFLNTPLYILMIDVTMIIQVFIKFARLQEAEADHPTHATPHREEPTSTGTGNSGTDSGVMRGATVSQVVGIGIVGRRGMGVAYGADGQPVSVSDETAPGTGLGGTTEQGQVQGLGSGVLSIPTSNASNSPTRRPLMASERASE